MKRESEWLRGIRTWMRTVPRADPADYETRRDPPTTRAVFHHVQRSARTSPELVRRLVAEKKAEMKAEKIRRAYRGNRVERRLANEAARNFRSATASEPPRPYDRPAAERRRLDELREARR